MVVPLSGHVVSAVVFGKLPAHGDFVARGVAGTERADLDAWLAGSLIAAREALGDADERFDRAQPWRATGAGVVGAIAPSRDGAGRRFPLLLLAGEGTAEACEELLFQAITERWDIDTLAMAAGATPGGVVERWFDGTGAERLGAMPADLLAAMLA